MGTDPTPSRWSPWAVMPRVPPRPFAACRTPLNEEPAYGPRALPACRYGLRQDGDGRRSGALFGARAGALDRRLGFGWRHPQHRLPKAVLYALQSGQAASVLAPVAAPLPASGMVTEPRVTDLDLAFPKPGESRSGSLALGTEIRADQLTTLVSMRVERPKSHLEG